jgi:hypothetical protein|tara:strand:- start:351 stop:788 length:438 start_codon:yes stop_codon:yes gene_type:complete
MLKNIISYIFIYILLVGCENVFQPEECSNCFLELSSELYVDENDYSHLYFNHDYIQTFTRIDAYVGYDYEYVGWTSNTQYCFEWNGTLQCNSVVNGSSYSGSDGIASTMLGVHQEHIGDTIKVYCGYYDDYGKQWLDSLEVIVNE